MRKKVLMVSGPIHPNPPLKGAAVETWMYEVSKRFIGFEPHIVSISHPFYPDEEYKDDIFFHRIHFGRLYKRLFQKITRVDPLSYPKRVARVIHDVRPDLVHMHNFIRWFDPLVKNLNKNSVKTILHMHNEVVVTNDIEVDAFAGCSKYIVDSYKGTAVKAKHYCCIYNGVDLKRFKPYWEVHALREEIRNRFGIHKDEFVVLFVGRISPEKGVEHFIKSAFMLKDLKKTRFLVIGEISEKGGRKSYAEEMMRMAAPLGDRITFFGVFPPSKIHLLYLLGDAIVLPSNFNEPFAMVAIEAMATGLPVVASQKGGLKEYIVDGFNGFFIREGDFAEDIAKKIESLISDKRLKETVSHAGRKTVEDRFSWEHVVSETEKLYSKLIVGN